MEASDISLSLEPAEEDSLAGSVAMAAQHRRQQALHNGSAPSPQAFVELAHATSAPALIHGATDVPLTPQVVSLLKDNVHPSQHKKAHKYSDEELRLCARLMCDRLNGQDTATQGRGAEDIKVGTAFSYLTNSGEASNEFQAARLGQRMIDREIWYHMPSAKNTERSDFTLDLGRDEVFRFANTAPLSRKLWDNYHASVEKHRQETSVHHDMRADDTSDVLVLKLKQALVRKESKARNVQGMWKGNTRRIMARRKLQEDQPTKQKADLGDVGIEVSAMARLADNVNAVAGSDGSNNLHGQVETTEISLDFSRKLFLKYFANGPKDIHGKATCSHLQLHTVLNELDEEGLITLPQYPEDKDRHDEERAEVVRKVFTYLNENHNDTINETEFTNVGAFFASCCSACHQFVPMFHRRIC
eukprot:COSAG02_NODE_2453_length_8820_cov_6.109964_3_plen_416_part_00